MAGDSGYANAVTLASSKRRMVGEVFSNDVLSEWASGAKTSVRAEFKAFIKFFRSPDEIKTHRSFGQDR